MSLLLFGMGPGSSSSVLMTLGFFSGPGDIGSGSVAFSFSAVAVGVANAVGSGEAVFSFPVGGGFDVFYQHFVRVYEGA